ncbi:hypothetical protein BDW62DRAFT_204524 [Aspergillus aurantiobrunneus]
MAEALAVIGAVAAGDQLVKSFAGLYKNLRKAYKTLRYARRDIEEVMERTETMKELCKFFDATMQKVKKIRELRIDLRKYKQLDIKLSQQGQKVINKINYILDLLRPLWRKKPTTAFKEFRARLEWFFRSQDELRLLYAAMDRLTGCINIFIGLVNVQMSVQQVKLSRSYATKVQLDAMQHLLQSQLDDIQRTQLSMLRRELIVVHDEGKKDIIQEMRQILKEECSEIQGIICSDPSPPSTPAASPSTPPTSLPSNPGPRRSRRIDQTPDPEPGWMPAVVVPSTPYLSQPVDERTPNKGTESKQSTASLNSKRISPSPSKKSNRTTGSKPSDRRTYRTAGEEFPDDRIPFPAVRQSGWYDRD